MKKPFYPQKTHNLLTRLTAMLAVLALAALAVLAVLAKPAAAADVPTGTKGSVMGNSQVTMMQQWLLMTPTNRVDADKSFPNGMINYGPHGETAPDVGGPPLPGKIWPITLPPSNVHGPEKMMAWAKEMDQVTGYSKPEIGTANLTPGMAALAMATAGQMLADQLESPQATIPKAREEQNQQVQQSADNNAAMERSQAGAAIDFVASYLHNFTVDDGNKWNKIRNELFIPMAVLLLLPGAALAQTKSIATQGFPVLGETTPFEGITRSIIATFLIPATYLVVNYGIDVSNSIGYTISSEYQRIFGSDMYQDAMAAHIRAFPAREPAENHNYTPNEEPEMGQLSPNQTPFAKMEGKMLDIKLMDPVAKLNIVPPKRANEQVPYAVNAQRNAYNTANAALAMTWNILCAFQMAYLYYLWFVGPVVAALWVYPSKQLRDAFPNWCEGVITLCFWSLFWNTAVLLMACFRGVDDTGTVIMTALNFLSTACVKFAFDFAGLVRAAGQEAARVAEKAANGGGGGKGPQPAPTPGPDNGGNDNAPDKGPNVTPNTDGKTPGPDNGPPVPGPMNASGPGLGVVNTQTTPPPGTSTSVHASLLSGQGNGHATPPLSGSHPAYASPATSSVPNGGLQGGLGSNGLPINGLDGTSTNFTSMNSATLSPAEVAGAAGPGANNLVSDIDINYEGDDVNHNYTAGLSALAGAGTPSLPGAPPPPPVSMPPLNIASADTLSKLLNHPGAPPISAHSAAAGSMLAGAGLAAVAPHALPPGQNGNHDPLSTLRHDLTHQAAQTAHDQTARTAHEQAADTARLQAQTAQNLYRDTAQANNTTVSAQSLQAAADDLSTRQAAAAQFQAQQQSALLKDATLAQLQQYQSQQYYQDQQVQQYPGMYGYAASATGAGDGSNNNAALPPVDFNAMLAAQQANYNYAAASADTSASAYPYAQGAIESYDSNTLTGGASIDGSVTYYDTNGYDDPYYAFATGSNDVNLCAAAPSTGASASASDVPSQTLVAGVAPADTTQIVNSAEVAAAAAAVAYHSYTDNQTYMSMTPAAQQVSSSYTQASEAYASQAAAAEAKARARASAMAETQSQAQSRAAALAETQAAVQAQVQSQANSDMQARIAARQQAVIETNLLQSRTQAADKAAARRAGMDNRQVNVNEMRNAKQPLRGAAPPDVKASPRLNRFSQALGKATTTTVYARSAYQGSVWQSSAVIPKASQTRVANPMQIDYGNTLRRYRKARRLTDAELSAQADAARCSGTWLAD